MVSMKKKTLIFLLTVVFILLAVGIGITAIKPIFTHVINKEGISGQNISKEDVEGYMTEMSEGIKKLYTDTPGHKSASGLPDDVNGIVKIELVPNEQVYKENPDFANSLSAEEKEFYKGKYELRITFDNGEMIGTGPYSKMPRIIKIGRITVQGKPKKVLIIEE